MICNLYTSNQELNTSSVYILFQNEFQTLSQLIFYAQKSCTAAKLQRKSLVITQQLATIVFFFKFYHNRPTQCVCVFFSYFDRRFEENNGHFFLLADTTGHYPLVADLMARNCFTFSKGILQYYTIVYYVYSMSIGNVYTMSIDIA